MLFPVMPALSRPTAAHQMLREYDAEIGSPEKEERKEVTPEDRRKDGHPGRYPRSQLCEFFPLNRALRFRFHGVQPRSLNTEDKPHQFPRRLTGTTPPPPGSVGSRAT